MLGGDRVGDRGGLVGGHRHEAVLVGFGLVQLMLGVDTQLSALVIRDLPEGATFLDARYSGIEWIHRAERAWSIGEFRADPRTGEILQAVARIDSHRRRTTARQWWNLARPSPAACASTTTWSTSRSTVTSL